MLFERLGHFVFRHRRKVILSWCVLLIVGAVLAPMAMDVLRPGAQQTKSGEAVDGYGILEQELGIRPHIMTVVFTSETLRADDQQFMDEMDHALAGLQDIEDLDPPITYRSTGDPHFISADGHTTYAAIGVDGDLPEAVMLVPDVREGLRPQPHLTTYVTGEAAFSYDIEMASMASVKTAEMYTFPLVAIILILVFGSLVAAGLPLAIGGASIVLSMALVFLLTQITPVTTSGMIMIMFVGLAISIDYALIMVTRFRQELRAGKGIEESVATTVGTSGKAIFYAALTSTIGFGALISYSMLALRSIGIGGVLVLTMALAAGLTLVPALLAILGPRVNRLALFRQSQLEGTFWHRLARWEMRHPALVLLLVVPFIGLLSWPVGGLNIQNTPFTVAPETTEARQGYEVLCEGFGAGELAPTMVAVTTGSTILDPDKVGALYDFTREVAGNEEVVRIESIVNLDPSITREQYQLMYAFPDSIPDPQIKDAVDQLTSEKATLVRVYATNDPFSEEAEELVTYIRDVDPDGLTTYVTGPAAHHIDSMDQMYSYFPWVLLIIGVTTYLALLWLFKSVLLPLKAILLNIASVAAAYGIIVFIFQEGHFSGVLNFTSTGGIEPLLPIIAFCVIFGLSIDYEVFLLSRMREEWVDTRDNTASVAVGLARTARVITGAAAIMVVVFGSLLIGGILFIKIIGVGIALAILIDAAVIRVFMAPALMRVMGKWNWWAPSFLERLWTPRGRNSDKDS
jgi:RND superfamily putative drug exporter